MSQSVRMGHGVHRFLGSRRTPHWQRGGPRGDARAHQFRPLPDTLLPDYLTVSVGKAGIRAMTEALFPQLAKKGIHIATVTVAKFVGPGSSDAKEVADEFWNLHNQPRDKWAWDSIAK